MNSDGKIYIVITDKMPADSTPMPEDGSGQKEKKDENSLFAHWAREKLISEVRQIATSSINYSLSNVGNFTGDYITQTHINQGREALNALVGIGSAAIAGFKIGGVYGAIIGASLAIVNQTVQAVQSTHSAMVANRRVNYEIEQLRARSGLNVYLDGSRGTEN